MEIDEKIEQLYREMYELLYAYAYSALHSHVQAEDAVQETFRIACVRRAEVFSSPNPKGWLRITLKHVIYSIWHKNNNKDKLLAYLTATTEQAVMDEIDVDILFSDIADSAEYQLIKRIAIDNCSMAELAQELGISVEACKKRVQRARKTLQRKLRRR
ncbi:MAG: sigma-70 family RNA polymerase sigma factor [Eubacteriales bacterium]|nr:sigma-70 family RNA polymerase sigma factor [Eubacteriales bacterium]